MSIHAIQNSSIRKPTFPIQQSIKDHQKNRISTTKEIQGTLKKTQLLRDDSEKNEDIRRENQGKLSIINLMASGGQRQRSCTFRAWGQRVIGSTNRFHTLTPSSGLA